MLSLANQEVLRWQLAMQKEIGDSITHENIKDYLWRTLKNGQVVPGCVCSQHCTAHIADISERRLKLRTWRPANVGSAIRCAPGILR